MRDLNERILSFKYTSIYKPVELRLQQQENFILEHSLKQFNEETIKTKKFQHFGYWESERVLGLVMGYLEQWESDGLRTPDWGSSLGTMNVAATAKRI